MSDFDKEAEREKLREKFERDREKRKQSERMSELLLKGATMTNKHHDCGSPIFRWKGEEFCPSCESPVDANAEGTADRGAETEIESNAEAGADAADTAETADGVATDGETADWETASEPGATDASEIDATAEPAGDDGAGVGPEPDTAGRAERPPARSASQGHRSASASGSGATGDETTTGGDGVAAARASLERTLADVAREAEGTSTADLTRKRNLIAAAREAAEALEATRRADRQ